MRIGALALGLALSLAAADARAEGLVILPVKFLDTSQEKTDQAAAHAARAAAMATGLGADLDASYDSVTLVPPAAVAEGCASETPECLVGLARAHGADQALFVVIHKSSTLIMQIFAQLLDVKAKEVVIRRELSFRGDTDESWRHAEVFLARQLSEAMPAR